MQLKQPIVWSRCIKYWVLSQLPPRLASHSPANVFNICTDIVDTRTHRKIDCKLQSYLRHSGFYAARLGPFVRHNLRWLQQETRLQIWLYDCIFAVQSWWGLIKWLDVLWHCKKGTIVPLVVCSVHSTLYTTHLITYYCYTVKQRKSLITTFNILGQGTYILVYYQQFSRRSVAK